MNSLKHLTVAAGAALFIAACAGSEPTNDKKPEVNEKVEGAPTAQDSKPDELASARTTYQEYCIRCHKPDGKGGPNDFQGNPIKVPDFTSERVKALPDEKYIKYITNGEEGEMPAFKDRLTPEQINGLVRMIRTDFQGNEGK